MSETKNLLTVLLIIILGIYGGVSMIMINEGMSDRRRGYNPRYYNYCDHLTNLKTAFPAYRLGCWLGERSD